MIIFVHIVAQRIIEMLESGVAAYVVCLELLLRYIVFLDKK